ncbi:Ly6/PLAUR domain-containing protein 1 [Merluccius polli]|uniref:Ly6/PLAUR domain-containing protein 1 n=1 Tax=Merluccius polli TaxID=89951 RepID=A0AA47MX43_MERPO|nr:Ly6/PLAUR domain-containing protein 1 [Merluccius polli]
MRLLAVATLLSLFLAPVLKYLLYTLRAAGVDRVSHARLWCHHDLQRCCSKPRRASQRVQNQTAPPGLALQIQCYQCEEMTQNECSTPEFVVNCTVNVQDMCQKEVLVKENGVHYRKSCASSGACLIASSGYQQFCTGKINSVCISCCNTPLCNGPRPKKRPPSSATSVLNQTGPLALPLSVLLLLLGYAALC